jgi:hypothetical protein
VQCRLFQPIPILAGSAALCSPAQCSTVQCNAVQCCAVQCSAAAGLGPLGAPQQTAVTGQPGDSTAVVRWSAFQCSAVDLSRARAAPVRALLPPQCKAIYLPKSRALDGPYSLNCPGMLCLSRTVQCSAVQCSAFKCNAVQCIAVYWPDTRVWALYWCNIVSPATPGPGAGGPGDGGLGGGGVVGGGHGTCTGQMHRHMHLHRPWHRHGPSGPGTGTGAGRSMCCNVRNSVFAK